jgi:hypothetical protein
MWLASSENFPFPFHWPAKRPLCDQFSRERVLETHGYPKKLLIQFQMWKRWIVKHILTYYSLFARNCNHKSWARLWHEWFILWCNSACYPIAKYGRFMWDASQWNHIPKYRFCLQIDVQLVHDMSGLWTAESIQKTIFALSSEHLCRSEGSRERAVQIDLKHFHEQHKSGSFSGTFIRLRFPRNRKYIDIWSHFREELREK